jgi:predicted RNA-binding protein with PIN domain
MPLLIDGYNLMYAAGIDGGGRGPGGLERSRYALIHFIAGALSDAERGQSTIVFDAAGAPPGLPATLNFDGLTVRFARGYGNADEMLEELIAADHSPRKLTVVSSDHRVQRAAKRRRATAVDSDVWYEGVLQARSAAKREDKKIAEAAKPQPFAGETEVKFWLDRIVSDAETRRGTENWHQLFAHPKREEPPKPELAQPKKKKRRL